MGTDRERKTGAGSTRVRQTPNARSKASAGRVPAHSGADLNSEEQVVVPSTLSSARWAGFRSRGPVPGAGQDWDTSPLAARSEAQDPIDPRPVASAPLRARSGFIHEQHPRDQRRG